MRLPSSNDVGNALEHAPVFDPCGHTRNLRVARALAGPVLRGLMRKDGKILSCASWLAFGTRSLAGECPT